MGRNRYAITISGERTEHRFGEVVQIVKGIHSWFFTVHLSHALWRCDGCAKLIGEGQPYARLHTPRFEMTGKPAVERICKNCLAIGKHPDSFSNVETRSV